MVCSLFSQINGNVSSENSNPEQVYIISAEIVSSGKRLVVHNFANVRLLSYCNSANVDILISR